MIPGSYAIEAGVPAPLRINAIRIEAGDVVESRSQSFSLTFHGIFVPLP
jgi:hypothetical protein